MVAAHRGAAEPASWWALFSGQSMSMSKFKHRPPPSVAWSGPLNEVAFHRHRNRASKYASILEAIRNLPVNRAIAFQPTAGEDLSALKARIASMIHRECVPPEGMRYRTRLSNQGLVVVSKEPVAVEASCE